MATLAVISHRVGLHDLLTHLHLLQDTLRHQGAWGYLVYVALFIIATLCLIPGSLLVIAGGLLFALVQMGKRFARARRMATPGEEVRHDPT